MNNITRSLTVGFTAVVAAFALSACSSEEVPGVNVPVPGASDAPTVEETVSPSAEPSPEPSPEVPEDVAIEDDGRWGIDPSSIEIPADVREAYGDAADSLVLDAMVTLSMGYLEPAELHVGGYADETYAGHWSIFAEERLTSDMRDEIGDGVGDADTVMPVASQDGTVLSLEGVDYTSVGGWTGSMDRGVIVELDEDGRAVVAAQLVIVFDTEPANVTLTRNVWLHMVPGGDEDDVQWLVDRARYETPDIQVGE